MGGFLGKLVVVKVSEANSGGRAQWALEQPLAFESVVYGQTITVPAGFLTDFASVPRAPISYWLAGDTAHASAVIHDYLCRLDYPSGRIGWAWAAAVFREAMEAEGVPAWRRAIMHWAVAGADPANQWKDET
jgi:hypothetical protein